MTNLRLIVLLVVALPVLSGCIHSQANFAVSTGGRNQPAATTVFADADTFAKRHGFQIDNIQVMKGLKKVSYHRNDNYLSVEHRTDARTVDFNIAANSDAYHRGVADRFRRNFLREYSARYGEAIIAEK